MQTESIVETPFQKLSQVLSYINEHNPARAKYAARIEPEAKSTRIIDDFTGDSPQDIFASAWAGVVTVLREQPYTRAAAWGRRNLGPRDTQLAVEEIADRVGRSVKSVYRWLDRIDDEMQKEFERRELIPSTADEA